ncbi:flavodoxin reductase (ferredoxin-nadph reductase) family 1 [hydrocarbon metagenome]|uniref:Flavodoxin reductase (Ferredoxin-nadph reductase) family 1 n=1 Tax=hydrocarbon metagenome TaxID=938273 RepID=A0A0W8FZZ6_9ZZZZ
MNIYKLSEIYIYPIKSIGGFSVDSAEATDRGFKYDRRWMLVDNCNRFLTQRAVREMALLQTKITENSLVVFNKRSTSNEIEIPLTPVNELSKAVLWDDTVDVIEYSSEINEWFSKQLNMECKLTYMPDNSERKVDKKFAINNEITNLSDGYPFLILGQESLNLLNSKLDEPLPINRFRPNLVFTGGLPHDEDNWKQFSINNIIFKPVKPCSRCVVTTIDQQTGEQSTEPLKTLSTYRTIDNKVKFGMNLLHEGRGIVRTWDLLEIIR